MRHIVLNCTSPYEQPIDRATGARIWENFLAGGSDHSAQAAMLPYIVRRCEREGVGYVLTAQPGLGYHIAPGKVTSYIHGRPVVHPPRIKKKSSANFSEGKR